MPVAVGQSMNPSDMQRAPSMISISKYIDSKSHLKFRDVIARNVVPITGY